MTARRHDRAPIATAHPSGSAQTAQSGFPIVGIGASAGGLEAFTVLFKSLLPDLGMAYVLVPHLDPQRESAISNILSRTTSMPVVQIENGMMLQPNHVYVIPPNCDLVLKGLCCHIGERDQARSVNATIDIFFCSLATEHGSNAIGIVLSGTASDGTPGLTVIKGEGREAEPLTESERAEKEKQIAQLKQELSATKEYLQSIIEMQEATNEELQSANEEIQSGNEELQSTNEELQTSKEELESANEELHTVNEEMQHRNDLLTQLNNDLTNLLNSVNLAMVMVSSDLSVRRFTPQATAILGLGSSDIGRPILRLKLRIDVRSLEQMMVEVIQQVQPRHSTVQDEDGRWFSLRITPYRTLDNRIDGVVLTVVDRHAVEDGGNGSGKSAKRKKAVKKTARRARH